MASEPEPTESTSAAIAIAMFQLPLHVDLALHAAPAFTLCLDFFLFEKRYSKKQALYGAPVTGVLMGISYVSWIEYLATINGRCESFSSINALLTHPASEVPYPFLNHAVEVRAIIYIASISLSIGSFWLLNALHW